MSIVVVVLVVAAATTTTATTAAAAEVVDIEVIWGGSFSQGVKGNYNDDLMVTAIRVGNFVDNN